MIARPLGPSDIPIRFGRDFDTRRTRRRALAILRIRRVVRLDELASSLSCLPDRLDAILGRRPVGRVVERLAPVAGDSSASEHSAIFYRLRERDDRDDLWQSPAHDRRALAATADRRVRDWIDADLCACPERALAAPSFRRLVHGALRGLLS